MKGYYKNWYQHYLEVEKEKEKKLQRGYYSNLVEKSDNVSKREKVVNVTRVQENHIDRAATRNSSGRSKKKKNKFSMISFLLPGVISLGFVFLWYQMGIVPVRSFTHEVLVFTGLRERVVDVVSYHITLLDQHTAFAALIDAYMTGEAEDDFESLQLIYDEIRAQHIQVALVSGDDYEEATRLWPFMLYSTSGMMREFSTGGNIDVSYEQFVSDQEEIKAMIRSAIGLDAEI